MDRDPAAGRLFLLGRFAFERRGALVSATAWRRRRPVEILVALALAPGRVLHREELIDRLWPDKDLEAGANNLYRALHDLRRAAGDDVVVMERGTARLADSVWVDIDAFDREVARGDPESLARAVALYHGDLLPDEPYRDDVAARREGLRQRFIDAALRLADARASDVEQRIDVLRRLVTIDPVGERGHRALMAALNDAQRPADALRQFSECVKALQRLLSVGPSAETLALRDAIVADAPANAGPVRAAAATRAPSTPSPVDRLVGRHDRRALRGRNDELTAIDAFLARGAGAVLLVGEAGIGKTRLLAECVERATARDTTVLVGIANDFDAHVPYAPCVDAWAEHLRATGAPPEENPFLAFVPRPGASPQEDRLRLFQSIERSLAALGPTCLLLEDLHRADESSLHLFHHLARTSRHLPLMLVGTLRVEEIHVGTPLHALLGSLRRERLDERIELRRLDDRAVRDLVADLAGDGEPDAAVLSRVTSLCAGNPFYVEEVVRSLSDGSDGSLLSRDVREAVRVRVQRLGPEVERFLAAASVVGQRFAFDVARRAFGGEAEAALAALERSVEAHILVEDETGYRFRHALAREALYATLTQARRVHLHRAVAQSLEELGSESAEALAHHHQACGQLEPALAHTLRAAARARARLGFGEAVTFAEQALGLMDALGLDDGPERFAVLRDLGGMRVALADLEAAVRDLDTAASMRFGPAPAELAQVHRVCALALIEAGDLDGAERRLARALEAVGAVTDSPELSRVLYLTAQLRWHQERFGESYELAKQSLDEALRRGDVGATAKGYEMMALACHSLGEWQEGLGHERERQRIAGGALDVDNAFDVHLCLWEYHLYGDRGLAGIREAVERTREQAHRMQAPRALALCLCFEGTLDFQAGRWGAAERALREGVELYRKVGSACGESLTRQRLGVLLTARGEIDEAKEVLDEGIVVGERAAMRSHCLTRLHASMTRNRLAAGDVAGAEASLADGLSTVARHGQCATCSSLLLPEAVRVALAVEDHGRAEAHAASLEEIAARFGSRTWRAMARHGRARILKARGRWQDAASAFDEARGLFDAAGHAYEAARAATGLASVQRRLGKRAEREASRTESEVRRVLSELGCPGIEG